MAAGDWPTGIMFKTIKWNTGSAASALPAYYEKKKKRNKSSSSQAGGPAPDESGLKQLKLTSDKLIGYYRTHK